MPMDERYQVPVHPAAVQAILYEENIIRLSQYDKGFRGISLSSCWVMAVVYNDLHYYPITSNVWTIPAPSGIQPSARNQFGMAATPDGRLWVFGGYSTGQFSWFFFEQRITTFFKRKFQLLVHGQQVVIPKKIIGKRSKSIFLRLWGRVLQVTISRW